VAPRIARRLGCRLSAAVVVGSLDEAYARAESLMHRGGRLLGIAGQPGSGKSTVTAALLAHFGERAAALPMDGFHLSNTQLARLHLADVKGAPETFDVEGYLATLANVRRRDHMVYAPRFDRRIETAIAADIAIGTDVPLVITEGNYLLLRRSPWNRVRPMLDEAWSVEVPSELRRQRLIDRHIAHGRVPDDAREWVERSDERNARLVATESVAADVTLIVS
jgi:pantothenate kinase